RAAKKLNCTIRTIDRLIKKYKLEGKSGFIHKNRRRQPAHTFTSEKK
ncbi:MAG: helix-turn-helix domain-containing protein, partial [Fusobacteriaceae bacterium]